MRLFIGLMSGTSMDGIDAALVDVETNTLLGGLTRPYGEETNAFLAAVLREEQVGFSAFSQLNTLLGREFANAAMALLKTMDVSSKEVLAIGSHGQTICHDAMASIPYTVQLGCPHTIAELTGLPVVADFRTRDLIIGGQGAPFAPMYHQALFKTADDPLAIVNIGGIANVTYLAKDKPVSGYDVGPGNCLMDAWALRHLGHPYDNEGAWAATGRVIPSLLTTLLADPYFKRPVPKSIGKAYFSDAWLSKALQITYAPEDVQATLLALTATTIAEAVLAYPERPKRLALCGGGVHNSVLCTSLIEALPTIEVNTTKAHGIDPDFMEAMMMAWLADKAWSHTPLDFRKITHAKKQAIYGVIYAAGHVSTEDLKATLK